MKKAKTFFLAVFLGCAFSYGALSESVRQNFISSCEDGGSSPEFCECVFGKVEKKYSQKQIDAIELKLRRGHSDLGYSEFVRKASGECDAEISAGTSLGALAVSGETKKSGPALSPEELAALEALGLDAEFASGVVNALLESPEYRDVFLAECSVEIVPYLGASQARNSCECAYRKLASTENVEKWMGALGGGNLDDSLALETFLPCFPETFTPEMEKFLLDSCETVASKSVCRCIVGEIESHFTLGELLRKTLKNPSFIQGYATGAAFRCKDD